MQYYIYILCSDRNGTLYIGVTNDLIKRVYEHKNKLFKGFSQKYNIDKLCYYEIHQSIEEAIKREKTIKTWQRQWKIRLIEENNSEWQDLYEEITK